MSIHKKILEASKKFSSVVKNSQGFGYKYEDINSIIDAITPALHENGLYLSSDMDENSLSVICTDESGESIRSRVPLLTANILAKSNPMQNLGAAITYARRYALKNLFNLFAEDDDGESLTQETREEVKQSQAPVRGGSVDASEIIKFGKYKDKTVSEASRDEGFSSYCDWLVSNAKKKGGQYEQKNIHKALSWKAFSEDQKLDEPEDPFKDIPPPDDIPF